MTRSDAGMDDAAVATGGRAGTSTGGGASTAGVTAALDGPPGCQHGAQGATGGAFGSADDSEAIGAEADLASEERGNGVTPNGKAGRGRACRMPARGALPPRGMLPTRPLPDNCGEESGTQVLECGRSIGLSCPDHPREPRLLPPRCPVPQRGCKGARFGEPDFARWLAEAQSSRRPELEKSRSIGFPTASNFSKASPWHNHSKRPTGAIQSTT